MPSLRAGTIDLIVADLPYGVTACKWDSPIAFPPLWEQYKRLIKKNGAIVLTASQPFASALVMSNPKWFKAEWIWEKQRGSNFQHAKRRPMKVHENVLVFCEGQSIYHPQMTDTDRVYSRHAKLRKCGLLRPGSSVSVINTGGTYKGRFPRSVQKFTSDGMKRGSLHPTQKPVALMEYLIRTYSNEADTVMDNVMGSGTTGIACRRTGRHFIGIEKEQNYFDIASKRIKAPDSGHTFRVGLPTRAIG